MVCAGHGIRILFGSWAADVYDAWVAMGSQCCATCGRPMEPYRKGPGADEPGFCGFEACPCGCEDRMPRPRFVPFAPEECGGAFDGFTVSSDADPGL